MDAKKLFGWSGLAQVSGKDPDDYPFRTIFLYHGPSRTVFSYLGNGTNVQKVIPEELVFFASSLQSELGWDLRSMIPEQEERMDFMVESEVKNQRGEFCRIGDKSLTHCDLLVQLAMINRVASWHLPFSTLCARYHGPIMRKAITTMEKTTILKKRAEYFFRRVHPKSLRKMDIMRLCKNTINWEYLKKKLTMPDVRVMIAKRSISRFSEQCQPPACMETRLGRCRQPDPWSVFRMLHKNKHASEYAQFKTDLLARYPDPDERNRYLCSLPLKPAGSVLGALCIFSEWETQIVIWILCSDRAMGKALLEQFKATGKFIIIDRPLDDVIAFYTKCGFAPMDKTRMIYTPPYLKKEQEMIPLPIQKSLPSPRASPPLLPSSAPSPRIKSPSN